MKILKKVILFLVIGIILAIMIVLSLLNDKNEYQNIEDSSNENNADQTVIDTQLTEVKIPTTYYTVYNCIKNYLEAVSMKIESNTEDDYVVGGEISFSDLNGINDEYDKKQLIYNLLDYKYKEKNNIQVENVYNYINKIENINEFELNKMYEINGEKIRQYVLYVTIEDNKECFLVTLDTSNYTYMVKPLEYIEQNLLDNEDIYQEINNIDKNIDNTFEYDRIDDEDMAKKYFYNYKNTIINNPKYSYELLEENYRQTRFGSIENYKKYINDNQEEISKINIKQFLVNTTNDYTEYVCKDQYENLYIIKAYAVMNYKIELDTYTITTDNFKSEYKVATEEQKVQMNIDKFMQMINRHDYITSYNCISEEFKNNYFATQEEFEQFIKNNFFKYNKFEFSNYSKRGANLYTFDIKLTDLTEESQEVKTISMIVQLNEDLDFDMAFGM